MRNIIVGIIVILSFTLANSQSSSKLNPAPIFDHLPFTSVEITKETPRWAKLMYSPNPNMHEVQEDYKKWRLNNPTIKDGHTRNLKHLLNYLTLHNGIDHKGFIIPNLEEKIAKEQTEWANRSKKLRKVAKKRSPNNTDWTSIGPEMMYRDGEQANIQANIYAITQSTSNPDVLYAASEGAAIFRTNDRGENWFPTSDDISFDGPRELEVDPGNSEICYVSSRSNIYKTIDGGTNWENLYYNWNSKFSSIIIHPQNTDTIIAGGAERIIRSLDGGANWSEVYVGSTYDLKMKSDDPSIVFALTENTTTLQPEMMRSTDYGLTWTQITAGWPSEPSTRSRGARITVSDGFPDVLYAFIGAEYTAAPTPKEGSKVLKSEDAGLTWTTVLNYDDLNGVNNGQGFYDWDIEMSDTDPNIVVFGTQGRWLTTDGFATNNWSKEGGELGHADVQEILINGNDIWIANDGGIIKFEDETFSSFAPKMQGINSTSYWSFDQGWNEDVQVGTHYHNGTSVHAPGYGNKNYLSYGGAEPEFSALKQPMPDKAWSKGYGAVNGKSVPKTIDEGISSFSYNLLPNANYGSSTHKESEILIYPEAYNTHFAGKNNTLLRSDNFGISWDTVAVLGGTDDLVTKIEMSRANTQVMYVGVYSANGFKIHRSVDLGKTWSLLNTPPDMNSTGIYLSVDQENADILYAAIPSSNSSHKVYRTEDAGQTWENLTTTTLNGHEPRAIMSVAGTDGGLYLLARNSVLYRNSQLEDWEVLIAGLPALLYLRDIRPFYKENKLRIAGDLRGVFSADLYDTPTRVIPQATVNLVDHPCVRDTLYFDDFSTVEHEGATWSWSFLPEPIYIDDTSKRNPKVVFSERGAAQAIMALTKNGVTYTDTLQIEISNSCDADEIAGNAYEIKAYGEHMTISDLNTQLDAFTYSFWIRPEEVQQSTATMISGSIDNVGVNFSGDSKNITIHYPGYSTWAYHGGLQARANEWTHIALTSDKSTGDIILYVNGAAYNYTAVNSSFKAKTIYFDKLILGWQNNWWNGRWFNGKIDEFALYERALSEEEVRLTMHHPINPSEAIGLIHYYQFNEGPNSGVSYDKVDVNHGSGTGTNSKSTGPYGPGKTELKQVDGEGNFSFTAPGITMNMNANGTGLWSVSRINEYPDENPSVHPTNSSFVVIHKYSGNSSLSPIQEILISEVELADEIFAASEYQLHVRTRGMDQSNWNSVVGASALMQKTLTFAPALAANEWGQFSIDLSGAEGWIGKKSVEWNDAENWGAGVIPGASDHVIIPASTPYQPSVNIQGEVRSLKLMEGSSIQVMTGQELRIKG